MSTRTFTAFAAGVLCALLGLAAYRAAAYVHGMPAASVAPQHIPFAPSTQLMGNVRSGQPDFRVAVYTISADAKIFSGIWSAEGPSSTDFAYETDEAVYIEEGQVDIDYQGRKFSLKPGDAAFFQAGTTATWNVPSHVRKTWTIYRLDRPTRWYRRLFGSAAASH